MSANLTHADRRAAPAYLPPHGTRARYQRRCRCVDCRKANSLYATQREIDAREGQGNPVVDAAPARAHILELSKKGVGYRTVAKRSGVGITVVADIRFARRTRIRRSTLELILSITPKMKAEGAEVSARRAWQLINRLIDEGYTKRRIARELGLKRGLQIDKKRVRLSTLERIEKVYRRLMS